jgi:hypothetical protein
MKYFLKCSNEQEIRDRAFKLKDVLELDKPENADLRKEIEDDYHASLSSLKPSTNSPEPKKKEYSQEEVLEKITPLGLDVEICGKWLWIGGSETKKHRNLLKSLGCRWSSGKLMWYHRIAKHRSLCKDPIDYEEIKRIYGSKKVQLAH